MSPVVCLKSMKMHSLPYIYAGIVDVVFEGILCHDGNLESLGATYISVIDTHGKNVHFSGCRQWSNLPCQ
jgi:hypothetical protein